MALFRQVGSILKTRISQNSASSSASSMLNYVRCISSTLFVGGLSYTTDDGSLHGAFSSFGEVTSARIILDRDTGRSRGFGFVDFADAESAKKALAMDGQDLHGRIIRVNLSEEKRRAPRGGGYGSADGNQSGSGGYGGGGY